MKKVWSQCCKIKAGALTYAISIVLLLSLLSSALLFINNVHKQLASNCLIKEHLVFDNFLALQIGAESNQTFIQHISGDTSIITKKKWGVLEAITVKTFSKNLSIEKTAIVGKMYSLPPNALYINDLNQPIFVGGESYFKGNFQIPKKGFERSTVMGKTTTSPTLYEGKLGVSKNQLPDLNDEYKNPDFLKNITNANIIPYFKTDSIFSFKENTTIIENISVLEITNNLEGNVIVHSFDSILVKKEAHLENVILIAPIVVFENGFRGSVQVLASERIVCEDSVNLLYPSVLILNERTNTDEFNQNHIILIGNNSKILGGVLLLMQQPNYITPVQLSIKGGLIYGFVYNEGNTELQGKISGFLYTNNTYVHTPTYHQNSCFVDAIIKM